MYYLASPYWHEDGIIREYRYHRINEAAACLLLQRRVCIYSPITHNVPLSLILRDLHGCEPGQETELGYEFWVHTIDFPILRKCDGLIVLKLPGWDISRGVIDEINLATTVKMDIEFIKPIFDNSGCIIDVTRDLFCPKGKML